MRKKQHILAFDTANEQITIAFNEKQATLPAHRASNTMLLPTIEKLGIKPSEIKAVAVGRGPGSFTGVRIALATAKGIASALGVKLIGFSTLDAVAWNMWEHGIRGQAYVVADAMRKEIYPALYNITDEGPERLTPDRVEKADKVIEEVGNTLAAGDALNKYKFQNMADEELWNPSGKSLLMAINSQPQDPATVLPVYTRLSDAEEGERKKLKEKNLITGVQGDDITYSPLNSNNIDKILELEKQLMGSDAWGTFKDANWWQATKNNKLVGYVGGILAGDSYEILKIGVDKQFQKKHIATNLMSHIANDARDLGAKSFTLEVRASNPAIEFYKKLGLKQISKRKNYYSDSEDAVVMQGPLPIDSKDVGGMNIKFQENNSEKNHPIILAIESSCDETAAAIIADGKIVANTVASQIDFHKRFGGVVPEIASRKHIEAICGVVDVCFEKAKLNWSDIDAVGVTYAPGLVGALVVGMAYAKGAAWAKQIPLIGVNHLEGHLYANKLAGKKIQLPAIASIISGGNTMLVRVKNWGDYETLGTTIDDAVGEAFDKVAKALNLGYPGGPIISKLAKNGEDNIPFPRAMMHSGDLRFSLSGLKTAVITYIKENPDANINDICASFEQAVIDVQVAKAKTAIEQTGAKSFLFGGGVAANPELRKAYEIMCNEMNIKWILAPLQYCGDNAAMIAMVADERFRHKKFFDFSSDVVAHSCLDEKY